jgi:hypothetical protein
MQSLLSFVGLKLDQIKVGMILEINQLEQPESNPALNKLWIKEMNRIMVRTHDTSTLFSPI